MGNNIKNNTNSINNITWDAGISRTERWQNLGQKGVTLWFTGLSGSGKSTLAKALEQELLQQGLYCYRLDGDNIRHGLNNDLGFSDHERQENLRRVTEVAKLFTDSGAITLVSFISPFLRDRQKARKQHQDAQLPFYEVFVNTPINICENRDVKGLYAKARAGEIKQFTGIDSPYEAPINPDLIIETTNSSPQQSIQKIVTLLSQL